ncbi:MAG: shikimate dehydrogenase [Chitinophagaceae bacterium]
MRRFGLLGYPLSHSFSKGYFTEKFANEQIADCMYENFPIPDISELAGILEQHTDLAGLNVTIPYKEKVIPFLHVQSEAVQQVGACNCIDIRNGILTGYNTDVTGFELSMRPLLLPHHRKALVLGTGGAAKAVHFVLNKLGIDYLEVSRTPTQDKNDLTESCIAYEQVTSALLQTHHLLINTTPLGMYPNADTFPPLPYAALTPQHYLFDLVYNPAVTAFLQKGIDNGAQVKNGADMLVIQAEESWKIWNRKEV